MPLDGHIQSDESGAAMGGDTTSPRDLIMGAPGIYPWAVAVDASFGDERCACYSCGKPTPWREAVLAPSTGSDPVDGVVTRGVIFHLACWEAI